MNCLSKKIISYLLIVILLNGTTLKANPVVAVAGVMATASVVKSMLSNLINRANDEAKETLEQALRGISDLEKDLTNDLKGLEKATMEDLDKITQDRLSEFNSMLESTLAMVMQLEDNINTDLAKRVKATIAEANATWSLISIDINEKIVKTTTGIYLVVDHSAIQILRIIVVICAFILVIAAVFFLRKYKTSGYIALAIGSLFLIFSFTPFFSKLVTNFGLFSKEYQANASKPDPSILSTFPDALSFDYNKQGDAYIYGVNFVSDSLPSTLLYGTSATNLRPLGQVSITNTVIQFPYNSITNHSGTYFLQLKRGDNKKTEIINAYVKTPEQIAIKINYVIWQEGNFNAFSTQLLQVREVHRCGWSASYYKDYKGYKFEDQNWKVQNFSKVVINDRYLSDLNEYINGGAFYVDFKLQCKRFNRAGWYKADYYLNCLMESGGDTKPMANSGILVLYYNPENQRYNLTKFRINKGLNLYQMRHNMRISVRPIDLRTINREKIALPTTSISNVLNIDHFIVPLLPIIPGHPTTSQRFPLGSAPDVPGFTPSRTFYNVIVTSNNINAQEINQSGACSIRTMNERIFMQVLLQGESIVANMIGAPN